MSPCLPMNRPWAAALLAAALGLSASPARALATADTRCELNLGDTVLQTPFDSRSNDGPVVSSCGHEGTGVRFETIASSGRVGARALADYGVLEAGATHAASNAMLAGATAVASFADTLTIGSAAHTGAFGSARVTFAFVPGVQAEASADSATPHAPTASAQVSLAAQIPHGGGAREASAMAGDGPEGPSFSQVVLRPMDFRFIFGAPFAVSVQLTAEVEGAETGAATAGHFLYWGGFGFVHDAAGTAVDYTVSSFSGTDYDRSFAPVASVPEPATGWLLAGGVLLLAARRLRSGKRRRASR